MNPFSMRGTIAALCCVAFLSFASCSDDDGKASPKPSTDSGSDVGTTEAAPEAGDAISGATIGICQNLPQPPDVAAFLDAFKVPDDCRVSHLYTALFGAGKIQEYIDHVVAWTDGFLGCPPAPPVSGFAPAELPGVAIPLTQGDVDVILDSYVKAVVVGYKLSPAQEQTARAAMVELAKSAVKDPSPDLSLNLCPDAGG